MKLSNKILIGFFGFAFIYLTAVFAEIRLAGTPNIIDDTNSIAETADISGVAYIVLQDLDKDVNVIGSDQPRLEVRSFSGDLLQKMKYKISGDTLTLSELQSKDRKTVKISVFVPKGSLKGMTVNAAVAIVKGLDQEFLYISQNAGRIRISDNRIAKIHIEASGRSYLDISATHLDTLSATIEESQVHISSSVKFLQGSMKNNSAFSASDVDEIQFKKDESSRLNLYQ
jgi:hypothetical protein